jgi:hypothetical protein
MVLVFFITGISFASIYTPTAYWQLNETSGTKVIDSTGIYNGTISGNPVWSTAGKFGGCLDFDGNYDYVNLGNKFDFSSSNFTISFWFKKEGAHDLPQSGTSGVFISKYNVSGRQWYICQTIDGNIDFVTFHSDNSLGGDGVRSTTTYGKNEWVYVTAIRNGNTNLLYINGTLNNTCSNSGIVSGISTGVRIGIMGDSRYSFNGKIDDMKIYNYALSSNEVATLYTIPEPTTMCLFAFAGLLIRNKK